MAIIKPFAAIRPKKGLEEKIAALPYDVYNRKEAKEEVEKNPLSFLKIDRAETMLGDNMDLYDDKVYETARKTLWEMVEKGEFLKENKPCYYVYELVMDGRSQTGIAATASVDDYLNGVIKKHENTREEKELDRIRHVETCQAQTGPIFLAYRFQEEINEIVEQTKKKDALYHFCALDGVVHKIYVIDEEEKKKRLEELFLGIENIYIADGHHRCASAVKVALKKREEYGDYTGKEEFNYFLSVLFPDKQLMIMDYNRLVTDLNNFTPEEFLEKLKEKISVEKKGENPYKPGKKGEAGMFLEGEWYCLTFREKETGNPVEKLDVSLLQEEVLAPLLGITDPKRDKRIDFVGGIRGLKELERRVRTDCKVAFAMYPTSIDELFQVADGGLLMPPKSTWFEPKLRSGLLIHSIKD
ncbi:DUF1015 domain-containing protein [bacterium 1XD42-8]|nr:DUF1015 domain-containing protein [bacterium 1XD42-8]